MKVAFYDDCRGYWNAQTRAMSNCYKKKLEAGISPHEARESCVASYQKSHNKQDWILGYSSGVKK